MFFQDQSKDESDIISKLAIERERLETLGFEQGMVFATRQSTLYSKHKHANEKYIYGSYYVYIYFQC